MKSFGMPIVYFILTGTIASSLLAKINGIPHILTERWIYVVLTGVLLLYFALKKDITDLKPIAFFLFLGVLAFVVLLAVHMIFEQSKSWNEDQHPHKEYFIPFNESKSKLRLIYMVMTILVSVAFQTVFFPVLNNLKDNSKSHMMKTSASALSTAALIYTGVALISIYAFGHGVQSDILKNVVNNDGWETIVLGVLFAIVGSLHIPLIFFVAKEAMLIIIFTYFYTEQEREEVVVEGDASHLEDVSGISKLVPKSMLENGDGHSAQPTRSELNRTGISVLRKTSVIPNIDVSITKQVLAVNNMMLRDGGMKGYEEELKEQEGVAKEPSHRDLPLWIYLTVTITVYGLDIALASILDDVSIIFGFVGALSISMLFFILPGWFYLKSVALSDENGSTIRKIISWVYIIFGICLAIGGLTSVTVKIVGDKNHDPTPGPE
jgi:amino acid permease